MSRPSEGDWLPIVGIISTTVIVVAMMQSIPAKVQVTAEANPLPAAVSCECEDCRCCDACPGKRPEQQEGR